MSKRGIPELILLAVCLGVSLMLLAKTRAPQGKGSEASSPASASAQSQAATEKALRDQLEVTREYDQRLLSTVYWSLSGVFLLVVLVGGINWFTNYRLYERERESLREASRLSVQDEAAKLRDTFNELRQQLHKEAEQLHEDASNLRRDLYGVVEAKYSQSAKEMKESTAAAKREALGAVAEAEYENTRLRARYLLTINPFESLIAWRDHLIALKQLGRTDDAFFLGHALDGIEACLSQSNMISYTVEEEIARLLEPAPKLLAPRVEQVKQLMSHAQHVN